MGFTDRSQMPFRLPPDQMRRLEKAARYRGQTRQSFVQEVVLAEIAAIEESRRLKRRTGQDEDDEKQSSRGEAPGGGLRLGELLKQQREHRESAPPISSVASSASERVVVNVGSAAGDANGDVNRLALFVVNGEEFMQEMRLRTALEVLRATASSDEEMKVLEARLKEAVALKSRAASEANSSRGVLSKIFSMLKDD